MNQQKKFVLFLSISSLVFLFTSCGGGASSGAIFSAIESEVKLGKKTADWAVTSMVYYGGNLYCSNGDKIYKKAYNGSRGWGAQSTSYDGAIGLLASDDNNLYVLTYKPSTDVTSTNEDTYNYSDTQLCVLYGSTGVVTTISNVRTIFDNKAIGGREAFATTADGTTYKLNGLSAPTPTGRSDIASARKVNGTTVFFQSFLSTSDYSNTRGWVIPLNGNGSSSITEGNMPQFIIQGCNAASISIDLTEAGGDGPMSSRKSERISGLAYYEEEISGIRNEYLLVATTKGYYRVTLDGTCILKSTPHKNGEQLAGMGIIEGAFWTLPTGAIYAGVATYDKTRHGLWAYYPDGTWNVD